MCAFSYSERRLGPPSCQRTSRTTGGFGPARSLASSGAEMMAFMVTILAHGVAASSVSGYCARPGRSDHWAYGIGHMLYSRWTPWSNSAETDGKLHIGHPPLVGRRTTARPGRTVLPVVRTSARGLRVRDCGTRAGRRKVTGHREGPRRE